MKKGLKRKTDKEKAEQKEEKAKKDETIVKKVKEQRWKKSQ